MKTNELKSGDRVLLENGWWATIKDNKKGDIRMALVEGDYTEMGSIYSHNIILHIDERGGQHEIEYTPNQIKLKEKVSWMFG